MKKKLVKLCYALGALMMLAQINGCKDPVIKDKGITSNPEDNINLSHLDTATVVINTVAESPLLASGVTTGVLGSMDDQGGTGKTFASVYAQCLLSQNGFNFHVADSNAVIDSAVLSMPFINDSSKYGTCTKPIDILVYEVTQDMSYANTYYSNDAFYINSSPIGSAYNFRPNISNYLLDSLRWTNPDTALAPQIRVRLNSSFANRLLNTDSVSLSSSANFVNNLKGIYITTNQAKPGSGVFYFLTQSSKITLFYHTSQTRGKTFDFPITQYSAIVNHFDHIHSGYDINRSLQTAGPDQTCYVQSGAGTKVKLQFPYFKNLPKDIAITKAELIVPYSTNYTADSFVRANGLRLVRLDDTLAAQSLNAYNNSGIGLLTTRLDANNQSYPCYVFNLTEFAQRLLNGTYNNNGFYLQYSYTVRADRTIIYNDSADDAKKCKLKITYTKLN